MRSDKETDEILRCALTQKVEPDAKLQQKVLEKWKENRTMKLNKKWPTAAVVTACLVAAAVPVAAATLHYLSASEAVQEFGYEKMAKAFETKDAIEINKTQKVGGYIVTLLGVTSGKGLEQTEWQKEYDKEGTYVVVAVEKEDGTPMPDEGFSIEPFIRGCNPFQVKPLFAGGASFATWEVIDGVLYELCGVSNLECLADYPMYICVTDDIIDNSDIYLYDESTGEMTRNENYEGMNAIFDLQLDASKADAAKAEEYLKQFMEIAPEDGENTGESRPSEEYRDYVTNGDWKAKVATADPAVEATTVQRNNTAVCPYILDYEIPLENGTSGGKFYFYDEDFIDGVGVHHAYDGDDEGWHETIAVAEQKSDGTAVITVYYVPVSEEEVMAELQADE